MMKDYIRGIDSRERECVKGNRYDYPEANPFSVLVAHRTGCVDRSYESGGIAHYRSGGLCQFAGESQQKGGWSVRL
jgi:hypothetical protein